MKCSQYSIHESLGLLHTISTQHSLVKIGRKESNKWLQGEVQEGGISAGAVASSLATGLAKTWVGSHLLFRQSIQQCLSRIALSNLEWSLPAKSLQVAWLSGVNVRNLPVGLMVVSQQVLSLTVTPSVPVKSFYRYHQTNSLPKVTLLIYHTHTVLYWAFQNN